MSSVFLIAEAGVNHNGSLERAIGLVDAAADAGADAVKFQTFRAADLATDDAPKAGYQLETTSHEQSQQQMLKALELSADDHHALLRACAARRIEFMSSAFDLASLAFLVELGCRRIKIPSGEITNVPYLRAAAGYGKPMILSTGMSDLDEVAFAIDTVLQAGLSRSALTVLHCNTEYPTPMRDVNLAAMAAMGREFSVPFGYSDHTDGIEIAVAATALGASVIEKHLTLDRTLPGPDHRASLEPDRFAAMVTAIRNIELALGNNQKRPSASELPNRAVARRSVVAACEIAAGERFSATNLTTKRPGTGVSPTRWDALMARPARRRYRRDESIDPAELD